MNTTLSVFLSAILTAVFLSALIASLVFLAESLECAWKETLIWATITVLMIICWDAGPALRGLIPTWFTNGWVQIILGSISAVFTFICAAPVVFPGSESEPGVGGN